MIKDAELQFADGTFAPTAVGDNIAPTVHDTGPFGGSPNANTGRDFGQGEDYFLVITVKQAVTSAGAATVEFRLRTDTNTNLTTSPVDIMSSGVIPKATLIAGYQIFLRIPMATTTGAGLYKRYIGLNVNIGTAVLTAGMFEAAMTNDIQKNVKYANNYGFDS